MGYRFDQWEIPDRMMDGLNRYVADHIEPGGFLRAVLENDFVEAAGRADAENLSNLQAYAAWLYNVAPSGCWGSRDAVQDWLHERELAEQASEAEGRTA